MLSCAHTSDRDQEGQASWLARRCARPAGSDDVLLHAPNLAFQAPGGGEVQLLETGRALEGLGVRPRPFVPWVDRLANARLLHLFGMSREGLALAIAAKARGVPVVLSPICWFEPAAFRCLPTPRARASAWASYLVRHASPRSPHWRRALLQTADAILPNSEREAAQLARLFGIEPAKFRVVPNGVDDRFSQARADQFEAQFGLRDFVLYVGRVEPRKNVLGLIEALRGGPFPLVVIGDTVPGFEHYGAACRARGAGFTRFIPSIEHQDPRLASAYAAARVLALPSWFETPGLAALEAALAGCRVVVTPLGCTREYFHDLVSYAHPRDPRCLRAAIEREMSRPRQPDLAKWVRNRYLWTHVARKTAEVYDDLTP